MILLLKNYLVYLYINPYKVLNFDFLHTQVSSELITVPKWLPMADMHPVDYYSTFTKNCSGVFTQEEIRSIRASYYAMCAEADAMLG